jgi:Protein of unknown function (DUF3828)
MNLRCLALSGALIAGSPVAAASAPATPTAVVKSFYAWVFAPRSAWDRLPAAKSFLTPSFYALLASVMPYEQRTHREVLDADPFIDAQIEASGVTVGEATVKGSKATVNVAVHYPKSSAGGRVTVVLLETARGWRIDDLVGARGGSARANLTRAMAPPPAHR